MFWKTDNNVILWNGITKEIVSNREFQDRKREIFGDNAYIRSPTDNIVEEWKTYMDNVIMLYDATKNIKAIDLRKCGFNTKNAVRLLIYEYTRSIENPDPITKEEELYIKNSFLGGLMYGEDAELETAYEYDIKSAYPSIISATTMSFPIKEGKIHQIKELPTILKYGIYQVEMLKSEDPHINKLFRFNKMNCYTHFSITHARNLGLECNLVSSNCLLYETNRIKGNIMFGSLVKVLYDLKENKVPFAKELINNIWGVLCTKNKLIQIHLK